jgi:tRNA uridine 5-carboxymethylaminomethyl modification enzyme
VDYQVIVVGNGHAGVEAAVAAARMGDSVAIVSMSREAAGRMPCNPAVGGIGKGHLTVELDALGGVQGWVADRAGIQFKVLNSSRGPAVWGPRAQCDKERYSRIMGRVLRGIRRIDEFEGEVTELIVGEDGVRGVVVGDEMRIKGKSVILTTGTFIGGALHTGLRKSSGGRVGEASSIKLGEAIERLGVGLVRYKTGTPPRLKRESIELGRLEKQNGDSKPRPFSWRTREVKNKDCCWLTRTGPEVQRIVRENLDTSPLYSGRIEGTGPRYCPSIEDKIVRFPHHEEHTLFLEPETVGSGLIYVNGLSTSMDRRVQEMMVQSIRGLEKAEIIQYGYAVEYDVVAPQQVKRTMEMREVTGLFVAGQLLGSSGYEEAAAQGFLAGVNAVKRLRGEEQLIIGREQGYIGVLIDDLVKKNHTEPYRMLTSRAEHRIMLGVDSARERLMEIGVKLGLVPETVFHVEHRRWEERHRVTEELESTSVNPDAETREAIRRIAGVEITAPTSWAGLLRRQDVDAVSVADAVPGLESLSTEDREVVVGRLRYRGYLGRHQQELDRVGRLRDVRIPTDLVYRRVSGLSREVVENLERYQPRTLAEVEEIPGMTPAAVAILAGKISRSTGRS